MIEVLDHIPEELDNLFDSNICAPTFAELNDLAKVDNVDLRVIVVKENEKITACLPCCFALKRHHGVNVKVYATYSGSLHDYQRLYCCSQTAAVELTQGIVNDAKQCGCDIISINSVIPGDFIPANFNTKSEIKIFDSKKEEKGWKELYVRRSVKRFEHDARKTGDYHVEIIDGRVNDDLMQELKDLHILRWQFAGSSSAFNSNPDRIRQYLCHPENKHYLRIMLGDEILACHYGMRYGTTLLWHTPLINPKFMKLSPLRLLLAEESRYCEANGFDIIDFGLGDEAYKDGYCHNERQTLVFNKPLTLKGHIANLIGQAQTPFVKKQVEQSLNCARKVKSWMDAKKVHWVYFTAPENAGTFTENLYVEADSWGGMYDLAKSHNLQVLDWHYLRFKNDDSCKFVALADEKNILTYGWTSEKNRALLEGQNIEGRILYDFQTPEQFRNKGYYTKLLKHLLANGGGVIYADKKNIPSLKAIRKAGFIQL